jgi:hypothetical protein
MTDLIAPEKLFASLLDVERRITMADQQFGAAVLGQLARQDTRKILTAIDAAEAMFAQPSLPLRRKRRR